MFNFIKKMKFLVFCWNKGHKFGTERYNDSSMETICARCGFKKTKKFKRIHHEDEFFIY